MLGWLALSNPFNSERLGSSTRLLAGLLLLLAPALGWGKTSTHAATRAGWAVRVQPTRIVNGSPILLGVSPPSRVTDLCGSWLGRDVFFEFNSKDQSWYGIAAADVELVPANYSLVLHATTASGRGMTFVKTIAVQRAKYPRIHITVPTKFTAPNAEQLRRIDSEQALKHDRFARLSPLLEWSGHFSPPLNARISDVFGTERVLNGKVQSVHQGLDFGVPAGTPVSAMNAGRVLLARSLFFEGNCVVLDHGQGLLSLYMHLSSIEVQEGERVRRGQELGLSGGTGRATGPHLHVAVRWQGVYMDPETLLKLVWPQ